MSSGAHGSSLFENWLWTPTVDNHTDVTTMSASSISFRRFLFILTKAISDFGKLYLRLEFKSYALALHIVWLENGIL